MSTADKLNYLLETKNQIKDAIIEKGVEVSDTDTFRSYADKISNISSMSIDGITKEYIAGRKYKCWWICEIFEQLHRNK